MAIKTTASRPRTPLYKLKNILKIFKMPQVDKITFLPQVFWLTVLFIIFFFVILRDSIYLLKAIIQIRFKNIEINQLNKDLLGVENLNVFTKYSEYFITIFELTKTFYTIKCNYIIDWLSTKYQFYPLSTISTSYVDIKNALKNQKHLLTTLN